MMLPLQIQYGEPSGASDMPNLDASLMVERMGEPGLPPIIGTYMRASQYVVNCFFFFTIDMDDHNFPLQAPVFESIVKLHPQAKVHKHIENQHVSTASHSKSPPLQPSTMYYPFVSEEDYIITNLATRKNFTADTIDAILSTHHHPGSPVTLKNHTVLFDIIELCMWPPQYGFSACFSLHILMSIYSVSV